MNPVESSFSILKSEIKPLVNKKLKEIIPVEIRLANYEKKRAEIFNSEIPGNDALTKINKVPIPKNKCSKNIYGVRQRVKTRRSMYKTIASTTLEKHSDSRKYATIKICGIVVEGLLDSGATISCLGKGALKFLEENKLDFKRFDSEVKTANGAAAKIIGRINCEVEFRGVKRFLNVFVAPSLSQPLYLGCDFWDLFSLWPFSLLETLTSDPHENSHNLTPEETLKLNSIISTFPSFEAKGLGRTSSIEHKIDTGDSEPVKQRHYPYSPAVQKLVFEEIDRMIHLGVIERCSSPWNSPVCLVRKPGKNRLCLDSRAVNAVTKKDAYPLPHIEGLLSRLEDTHYISSVDLKDAYWQIMLHPSSREKTAFTIPNYGHFQFTRMPFGLCNAAQTLSRLMDSLFPPDLRQNVFVYLDDLLIVTKDLDHHFELLKEVSERLQKANLTINVKKSHFCFRELKYLGYIVGGGQLKTDPDKVMAIMDFPLPKTQRQVRRFLGMTGWYRRFIPNYAQLASPFTDSLKKSKTFCLSESAVESFNELKRCLTSAPILSNPDFSLPFTIQCDASVSGVGGVLFQTDPEGNERVIYYHSRKLNAAQKNYSITELECLAAIECVKKFRPFIELQDFKVVTDHASLKWLMSQKDLSGRLARWSLKLQGYKFEIEHRKGTENVVPDALSRAFAIDAISVPESDCCFSRFDMNDPAFKSDEYLELVSTVTQNSRNLPDLLVSDGMVLKKVKTSPQALEGVESCWKLWIPQTMTDSMIRQAHEPQRASHGGIAKTLHRLQEMFYWPNMFVQVKQFVSSCEICKGTKATNQISRPPMGKQMVMERPFQQLYIDLLGPYPRSKRGNTCLLICLDNYSKFVFIHPLRQAKSKNICDFLISNIFCTFGTPEFIFSDNGKQFISETFQNMLKAHGITHQKTPYYCPQANASERVNRSILAAVRSYLKDDHSDWDKYIPQIAASLRSSVHQAIQLSPFQALFGLSMVQHGSHYDLLRKLNSIQEPLDIENTEINNRTKTILEHLKQNLHKSFLKYEKQYNLRSKPVKFTPGQIVFRRNFILSNKNKKINAKLCHKFIKCKIKECIGENRYLIEDCKGKIVGIYHAQHLRA